MVSDGTAAVPLQIREMPIKEARKTRLNKGRHAPPLRVGPYPLNLQLQRLEFLGFERTRQATGVGHFLHGRVVRMILEPLI